MHKKYFYSNLLLILLIIVLISTYNFILDPYGIWKKSYEKQVLEPNRNYIKTKYIIENPNKYDSFIFGSSRVGYVEADLLPGYKYYNMTYSQGLPAEWLENLETFIKNNVNVKNVILAIDDFSFTVNPESHYNQPLRLPYNMLDTPIKRFKHYLFRDPFDLYNKETIKGIKQNEYPESNMDIHGVGRNAVNFEEEQKTVYKNLEDHLKDPKFNEPTVFYEENRIDQTLSDINKIIKICNENNIDLHIYLNPLYEVTYLHNEELVKIVRDRLSEITDFWDFTGLNEVTTNKFYWYETSHYRTIVGRMILQKMFDIDLGVDTPEDFGTYIKKKI